MSGVLAKLLGVFSVAAFLTQAKAASDVGGPVSWIDKEVKVVDTSVIAVLGEQDSRVLSEGGIKTITTAMTVLVNNGRGVFCKANASVDVKNGDVLQLKSVRVSKDEVTKLDATEISFSKEALNLKVRCLSNGQISSDELKENIQVIAVTKEKDGKFPNVSQDSINEEHNQSRLRQQKLKLGKLDLLIASGQINEKGELLNALVDGKIVDFEKAMELVYTSKAKMACSVVRMSAKAKPGDVYQLKSLVPMGADRENGVGTMQYQYVDSESRQLVFTCQLRLSAKVSAVFNTFGEALEF